MHLAEGVLPLSQAIAWSALAAPTVFWEPSWRATNATQPHRRSSVIMAGCHEPALCRHSAAATGPRCGRNQSHLPYAGARLGRRRPPHRVAHVLRSLAAGGLLRSRRAHDAGGSTS